MRTILSRMSTTSAGSGVLPVMDLLARFNDFFCRATACHDGFRAGTRLAGPQREPAMKRDFMPGEGVPPQGSAADQLGQLYARWRAPLARMMRRYFGSAAEVEDATQEVFARLAATGKAIAPADEQPYLRRAARNVAIDGWRKSAQREGLQRVALDGGCDEADFATDAGHTDAHAAQHQLLARLDQAIQELPARQRQAFTLHRIEGYTVEETALRMGISTRMVVKHLSRGLAYCQVRVSYASSAQMRQMHTVLSGAEEAADAAQGDAA